MLRIQKRVFQESSSNSKESVPHIPPRRCLFSLKYTFRGIFVNLGRFGFGQRVVDMMTLLPLEI